jgi:hypothetical protein
MDLSMNHPASAQSPPMDMVTTTTTVTSGGGILRQGDSRRNEGTDAPRKETIHSDALKNSDSSNGDAKPGYQRQRTISWGEKPKSRVAEANPVPTKKLSPKSSPTRHVRGPSEFSLFSVLTDSENGSREGSMRDIKVKLDDIVRMNPLETEAETLVMKIIEAQENANRERANTGILGNVPEEAVHVFLPPPVIDTTSTKSEATSKSAGVGSPRSNHVRVNTVDSQILTSNSPPSQMFSSTNSPPLLSTSANSNSRTGPPAPNQRPPRPNLARNVTVEHKLANLTEALAGFHNQTSFAGDAAPPPHEDHMVEVSAGEKLAQNANLIFRGRQKTEGRPTDGLFEDVSNNSGGSGGVSKVPLNRTSSHWSKVRTVAAMVKPSSQPPNADLSAIPNVNGYPAVFSSGSVEEHKKTDTLVGDNEHPNDDDMECGTAMHDNTGKMSGHTSHSGGSSMRKSWKLLPQVLNATAIRDFHVFVSQRRSDFANYLRFLFLVGIPALGAALILFYLAGTFSKCFHPIKLHDFSYSCSRRISGNPPTGVADLSQPGNGAQASISWWLIFICVSEMNPQRNLFDLVQRFSSHQFFLDTTSSYI